MSAIHRRSWFCFWLAWCRFRVVSPLLGKTAPSVFAAIDATLRVVGGVATYLLTDNDKTVTVEHVAGYGTAATSAMPRRRSTAGWRRSRAVRVSGDARSLGAQPSAARPGGARGGRGERGGLLGHVAKPRSRSRLRVREPRRLLRGLTREESAALLGTFRTWRDCAIAGLTLLSGLRSAEVLGLMAADVDIARRWVRVIGKRDKERRVPIDLDVRRNLDLPAGRTPGDRDHDAVRGG
jgi:integrase